MGVNRLLGINTTAAVPDTSTLFYRRSASFRGPRYAPDGVQLAYASNQNGNLDVYVGRTTVNEHVDVSGLVDGDGPDFFLGGSGDTLLVDFGTAYVAPPGDIDPIGYEGEGKDEGGGGASLRGAVSDASAAATPFAVDREVLRSSGFVVQGWTAEHGWRDARHVYPRESYSTSVVDTLDSGLVRLVFIGRHKLRRIEKIVPIGVAPLTPAALVSARHAKMGDVSRDLKTSDHQTTVLTFGDTVSLSFAAAPAVAGKKRSFFLGLRGFYTTTSASSFGLRSSGSLRLSLAQNRPNPFGASTRIDLALPTGMHVTLRMFDVQGRTVRTLLDGNLEAGRHDVEWDGRGKTGNHLAPGVYLCVMETPAGRITRRVVLMP